MWDNVKGTGKARPTRAVERTDTALSCGPAAHRQSRWPSRLDSRGHQHQQEKCPAPGGRLITHFHASNFKLPDS
jgi:hypothetical protein